MSKHEKLLIKVLRGTSDKNIDFEDFRNLLLRLGFEERIKGSHHILVKEGIENILKHSD
jgi:predicted RNA binding protein YcfA (HicA-like mRNA interferase family)